MKIELEVSDYSPALGLRTEWDPAYSITSNYISNTVHIKANRPGLVSLARLMLTLAQESVPPGCHWHLDSFNAFEDGSTEVIIEKA